MLKVKTARSGKYLKFIRSRPCCVTAQDSSQTEIHAHHVRAGNGGGIGLKPADYRTIPLTAMEHAALHTIGEREYFKQRGIDPDAEISMNLLVYLAMGVQDHRLLMMRLENLILENGW